MQIFLYKPDTFVVTESVETVFDGSNLRTYLNGTQTDSRAATVGECYYIQQNGKNKAPKITKAEMPESRGLRIAWALSFIGTNKNATDFNEFMIKYQNFINKELSYQCCMFMSNPEKKKFAIVLEILPDGRLPKPILAWIADDITQEELDELTETLTRYRKLFCPIEFLKLL